MRELIGVVETKDGSTPITMNADHIVFIKRWKDSVTGKMEEWNYAIFYNQYNSPKRVRLDLPNSIPFPKILDNDNEEVWINIDFVKSHRKFFDKRHSKFLIEMNARFDTKVEKSVNFIVKSLPSGLVP